MTLPSLTDIAESNVSDYEARFTARSDAHRAIATQLASELRTRINMSAPQDVVLIIESKYKSRTEVCAEKNGMTVDQFSNLDIDRQKELYRLIHRKRANWKTQDRRIDFSNKYEDGLRLVYLGPYMGIGQGDTEYGKYCVVTKPLTDGDDVIIKTDSLGDDHYNDDGTVTGAFNHGKLEADLLPYPSARLMISDKYPVEIDSSDVNELSSLRSIIEARHEDAMEMVTTKQIGRDAIDVIWVPQERRKHYESLVILNELSPMGLDSLPDDQRDREIDFYHGFKRLRELVGDNRLQVIEY
jgi:hypothetical protein